MPSNKELTNLDRADRANKALEAYGAQEEIEDDPESVIIDLLADLLHLAKTCGYDTEHILRNAQDHFNEEKENES